MAPASCRCPEADIMTSRQHDTMTHMTAGRDAAVRP